MKASITDLSFCASCGSESKARRNKGIHIVYWKRYQGFNRRFINAINLWKYFDSLLCLFIALCRGVNADVQRVRYTLSLNCALAKT